MVYSFCAGLMNAARSKAATYPDLKLIPIYKDIVYPIYSFSSSKAHTLVQISNRFSIWASRYWTDIKLSGKQATSEAVVRQIPWTTQQFAVRNLLKFGPALYFAADLNLKITQGEHLELDISNTMEVKYKKAYGMKYGSKYILQG